MHPLVIYAIVQFDQQERDRANERRRRALEQVGRQARLAPAVEAAPVAPRAPVPARALTPAVIGCRA